MKYGKSCCTNNGKSCYMKYGKSCCIKYDKYNNMLKTHCLFPEGFPVQTWSGSVYSLCPELPELAWPPCVGQVGGEGWCLLWHSQNMIVYGLYR